jgi:hypothetical protein
MRQMRTFTGRSSGRSTGLLSFAAAVGIGHSAANGSVVGCQPLSFGDFESGLAGWEVTTTPSERGDAATSAAVDVIDASKPGPRGGGRFDESTLQVAISAVAGEHGGAGAAETLVEISRIIIVSSELLEFVRGGGFGFQFFGAAGRGIEVEVEVVGAGCGGQVNHVIYSNITAPSPECGLGLSVLGTLAAAGPDVVDLEAAGIVWGEYATLTIRVRAAAETLLPCQLAISQAVVLIDGFQACSQFLAEDFNEDGHVNGVDLAMLLAAWGPCADPVQPSCDCPIDLDFSGGVDGADLAWLLASWG